MQYKKSESKNSIDFKVAENDVLWLEIFIPKSQQMPYSEFQIKRHIELLDKKAI